MNMNIQMTPTEELSTPQRRRLVAAAAEYMDAQHPGWAERVDAVGDDFDLGNTKLCVIGAGSGKSWTTAEALRLEQYVTNKTGIKNMGLTCNSTWERYWLAEVAKRLSNDATTRRRRSRSLRGGA